MKHGYLAVAVGCIVTTYAHTAEPVDYGRDVKPLLRERCTSCHGGLQQKGKLRLDTAAAARAGGRHGPAVVPGDVALSVLLERVAETDAKRRMPPEGKPLTAEQVALLRSWIEQGTNAPADEKPEADPRRHWAFCPPVRPKTPSATDLAWNDNPIDRFLAAEHAQLGLTPTAKTDRITLLRRVHLDLTGLPPTREELHTFLSDPSPDAYAKVVERLLASPHHGERWARHWMDVWRYSDWYGRRKVPDVLNSYGQIWRWRDWIVASLNHDRGYDDMVRLMLAADEIAPKSDTDQVATGFVVRNFFRWNYNNWMRDNVEHTAKAFLGLTLNCCHCHDHKYDPITQEEYFRFRAVFEPIEIRHDRWPGEADPGVYPKYNYGSSYKPITSGMVRVMDEKSDAPTRFYTGGDERNVVKDRPPIPPGVPAALGGVFDVRPVDLPPESWYPGLKEFVRREEANRREQAVRKAAAEVEKTKTGTDELARRVAEARLAAAEADLAALRARIAADDVKYLGKAGDYQSLAEAANKQEREHALRVAELTVAQAEAALAAAKQGKDTNKIAAAEKQLAAATPKVQAARTALAARSATYTPLSAIYPKQSSGRRSALARWITDRDNPLTARVAVNHVWAWHFGRPLVETTNNFGRSGKAPSHPALLDWLAVEFMDHGWSLKHLHRLIVTSRAYRMRSDDIVPSALARDPDNVALTRFPTNRLDAESVRDSLLQVAGVLDPALGGPEIAQDQGLTSHRRSLYFAHHGESRMEFLDLFDAANPCDAYLRTASVLPQQALALTNSELTQPLSRTLAATLALISADDAEFTQLAFEQVLGRPPRNAEAQASARFLTKQRELFTANAAALRADAKQPGTPPTDPVLRRRANLVLALFNHTDFVTVR